MKKWWSLIAICAVVYGLSSRCQSNEPAPEKEPKLAWLNHHDSVSYVGIETCQSCHAGIHRSFIETGMGQSLGAATTEKSIAEINGDSVLYDPHRDLYYQPYWQKDSLWIKEFRLKGTDTSHRLVQVIDYVIGSGQHTNSHLFSVNDHYYQAPFTWYAQKGRLDLPPGFEDGSNSRFSRLIGLECMSCHNAMPTEFVMGSTNKFKSIPRGINCERCHGPGGAHVAKIRRGKITDTSKEADRSIVNPKRLSAQMQFEICQRCHLQGNAVLKTGKSFFDFKPGMKLSEVMQVFLPRYSDSKDKFIMASHADRFKLSACYQSAPEQFTCTSCHNPHLSVKETNLKNFNATCGNCHGKSTSLLCSENAAARAEKEDNCVACHMPSSSSIDIPHVTVHDHFIRKPQEILESIAPDKVKFLKLEAINAEKPAARDKALAYLQQFERFEGKAFYLDSARSFINQVPLAHPDYLFLEVYYHFLSGNYANLKAFAERYGRQNILDQCSERSYDNKDAWTLYRVAEAFNLPQEVGFAARLYSEAMELAPYVVDFQNKYASLIFKEGQVRLAQELWKKALQEEPRHRESLNNLAYSYLQLGNLEQAGLYLNRCLKYYPDYKLAWLNKATWAGQLGDAPALKESLENILRLDPTNAQVKALYESNFQ